MVPCIPRLTPLYVGFQTVSKTALAGVDHESTSGRLIFSPGQTLAQIPVTVDPDTQGGANPTFTGTLIFTAGQSAQQVYVPLLDFTVAKAKTFSLKLGKPSGASMAINKSVATIAPG